MTSKTDMFSFAGGMWTTTQYSHHDYRSAVYIIVMICRRAEIK